MSRGKSLVLILAVLFLSSILSLAAQAAQDEKEKQAEPRPAEFKLTTERVVVFKDGYCLVVKRGTAKTDEQGRAFTEDVPDAAVLGSFWAVPQAGTIRSMTAGWVETEKESQEQQTCTQTIEIVQANIGKSCSFLIGENTKLTGKLKQVLTRATPVTLNDDIESLLSSRAHLPRHVITPGEARSTTITQTVGDQFVLQTEDGDMLVRAGDVRQLLIEDMKTSIEQTLKEKSKQKRLTFDFEEAGDVEIVMMYFRPGVRWIPTYRVNLAKADVAEAKKAEANDEGEGGAQEKKTAEIILQGEIINEAEDLTEMAIDVVVGVPNFRFRTVPSPLVLEGVMRNALAEAAPQLMGQQLGNNSISNAMFSQRSGEIRGARAGGQEQEGAQAEMPAELTGQSGNDLFVYHLPKMSLKKGERASVPIMRATVAYRDIYTWDIQVKHSETYAPSGAASQSPLVLSENKVWRQVELINDTNIPWTTGAAMFVDGFQPLAQELLTYTSPGGICRVPVTVAVDLRGKVEDEETNRKLGDLQWQGFSYARVSGQMQIELANNKTVPVPVEIRLRFGGKADEVSDDARVKLEMFNPQDWENYRSDTAVNNSSLITWKTTIKPEESFKPTVKYHFFTRH